VQPSRRQTARNTLSLLRSGTTTESSDVFSADLTDCSADLVLLVWAERLVERLGPESHAGRISSALREVRSAPLTL
jgi:hypothetical protein